NVRPAEIERGDDVEPLLALGNVLNGLMQEVEARDAEVGVPLGQLARNLGFEVEVLQGDWRRGVDTAQLEARLAGDRAHSIKALCLVHNETSTGVTSDIGASREVLDAAQHPALLMVDTVSSLGCIEVRHDAWRADVTVSGSQKGLMMPAGLGFNAVSQKALAASKNAQSPRAYFDWQAILKLNEQGMFPYTPPANLFFGLQTSLDMLLGEGLAHVFARHQRHAKAARAAVAAWGLETVARRPEEYSPAVTAIFMPEGVDADAFRAHVLRRFDMTLGNGLAQLRGRVFRIGHMGDFNDLSLMAVLSGVEMGLSEFGAPPLASGVVAAMENLKQK
ncbi:MAG: aminotransferase class V-fold PLP-dependent enzyme, partial [Pseudomonadota bacterium]